MKAVYTVIYDSSLTALPEVYYPRVRYIFDDDDPELLSSTLSAQHRILEEKKVVSGRKNRAILLDFSDVNRGSYEIARASSLSADWTVTDTRLSHIETTPSGADAESQKDEPWMLAIEGVDMLATVNPPTRQLSTDSNSTRRRGAGLPNFGTEESDVPGEDYKSLIRGFDLRMGLLRHIIQNSEQRQRPLSSSDKGKGHSGTQPSENGASHRSG